MLNEPPWNQAAADRPMAAGVEDALKVGIRVPLLRAWLSERWIDRCIRIEEDGLTMTQVQQIVDSLLPEVPVERRRVRPAPDDPALAAPPLGDDQGVVHEVHVVDRDAFALEIARDWVRAGLPRAPIL